VCNFGDDDDDDDDDNNNNNNNVVNITHLPWARFLSTGLFWILIIVIR
jgi:hypothetical protein